MRLAQQCSFVSRVLRGVLVYMVHLTIGSSNSTPTVPYSTLQFLDLLFEYLISNPHTIMYFLVRMHFSPLLWILSDISISYKLVTVVLGTSTHSLSSPLIISLCH